MIDHTRYHFGMLRDWLYFCEQVQDAAEVEFRDLSLDPEHVDEIQYTVRLLAIALDNHPDALSLANLWLAQQGPWRLVTDPSALYLPRRED